MQVLTINPNTLAELIKESFDEAFKPNTNLELSDDFPIMVDRLKEMAYQLEGFVNEYPKFIQAMQKVTQELGLQLSDVSSTDSFEMDDLSNGTTAQFKFEYQLEGYDVRNMSDEEYEMVEEKLNQMYTDLEIELNHRSFKFGSVNIYQFETGFDISYEFNFWQ